MRSVPEILAALLSGEADMAMSVKLTAEAVLEGAQMKCVLATHRAPFAVVGIPGVESMTDVKSLAFHSQDIVVHLVDLYLLDHGIDPADIEYRFLGGPGLFPAYISRQVDAANLGASTYNALEAGGKILWSFSEEYPHFLINGISTTDEMIANNPDVVKGMVKALYRSQVFSTNQ